MSDQYSDLGSIVNYLQIVTSPAHVVPVYFTRWWRFSLSDRFDGYPIDEAAVRGGAARRLRRAARGHRSDDRGPVARYRQLDVARGAAAHRRSADHVAGVLEARGRPRSSSASTGRAGNNFGRRAEFKCGDTRCVLLEKDPLYDAFALERHVDAVTVTMRAMLWLQRRSAAE